MECNITDLPDGATLLRLVGRLDTAGVDRVETRFAAVATRRDKSVLVDLSGVEFVGSMGVRMLISAGRAVRAQSQHIALFGAQPPVLEVLERVGLPGLMPVVADQAAATLAIRG